MLNIKLILDRIDNHVEKLGDELAPSCGIPNARARKHITAVSKLKSYIELNATPEHIAKMNKILEPVKELIK